MAGIVFNSKSGMNLNIPVGTINQKKIILGGVLIIKKHSALIRSCFKKYTDDNIIEYNIEIEIKPTQDIKLLCPVSNKVKTYQKYFASDWKEWHDSMLKD